MKKKNIFLIGLPVFLVLAVFLFSSMVISNPKLEDCTLETKTITNIKEGTSFDIVFTDIQGDHYYINRGLERGLNLESLNSKVLNKSVTLHLAKVLGGMATSEHITQLSVDNEIIFTELK